MGVVQLPAKADYWVRSTDGINLVHWMRGVYPMYCFNFVWRNISLDPQFASDSFWSSDTTERAKDDASTVASDATGYSEGGNNFNDHYLSSNNESDVDDDDDDSTVLEEDSKQESKD